MDVKCMVQRQWVQMSEDIIVLVVIHNSGSSYCSKHVSGYLLQKKLKMPNDPYWILPLITR